MTAGRPASSVIRMLPRILAASLAAATLGAVLTAPTSGSTISAGSGALVLPGPVVFK